MIFGIHKEPSSKQKISSPSSNTFQEQEKDALKYERYSHNASFLSYALGMVVFLAMVFGFESVPFINVDSATTPLAKTVFGAMFGLLTSALMDRFAVQYQLAARDSKDKATRMMIESAISRSFNVECIGDDAQATAIIAPRFRRARYVRNTFVNIGGAARPGTETEKQIRRAYEEFFELDFNNKWHDIVSVNEVYGFRHLKIAPKTKGGDQHIVSVLKNNMPIMNFTIIDYMTNDVSREVYFGWLYAVGSSSQYIMRSSDHRIVSLFEMYFDILKQKCQDEAVIDYSKKAEERAHHKLINKSGYWFTVSTGENGIRDMGIIKIYFENNRPIINGGIVFHSEDRSREIIHHDVVYEGDKIYFEYKRSSSGNKSDGFCVYDFYHSDGHDRIRGYYQDVGSTSRYHIDGVRIPEPKSFKDAASVREANDKYRELIHFTAEESSGRANSATQ